METVRVPFWPMMIGILLIVALLFSLVGKVGDQEQEVRGYPCPHGDTFMPGTSHRGLVFACIPKKSESERRVELLIYNECVAAERNWERCKNFHPDCFPYVYTDRDCPLNAITRPPGWDKP